MNPFVAAAGGRRRRVTLLSDKDLSAPEGGVGVTDRLCCTVKQTLLSGLVYSWLRIKAALNCTKKSHSNWN